MESTTPVRWRFKTFAGNDETRLRLAMENKIKAWWDAFAANEKAICDLFTNKGEFDMVSFMHDNLQAIAPELMWEFGPAVKNEGHRLIITPESSHHLRPLVAAILGSAPALPGWQFYSHRLPESFELAERTVEARTHGKINNVYVTAKVNPDANRVDLTFHSQSFSGPNDQKALHSVFVAAETLLGEEWLDTWVGIIEVAKLQGSSRGLMKFADMFRGNQQIPPPESTHISELKSVVQRFIDTIIDGLPDQSLAELTESSEWSLYKVKPKQADDYPKQTDIYVGKSLSMQKNMWTSAHNNELFDSRRFSKLGETFCYLKTDGSDIAAEDGFEDKGDIEDTIDAVLLEAGVGCFIGGGTGLKYSYVDIALSDVDRGIEVIRQAMQAGKISKRSWILFFDTNLESEWVGIWDDTPPPPQ